MSRKLDLDQYLAKYQTDEYRRKPIPNLGLDHQPLKYTSPIKPPTHSHPHPLTQVHFNQPSTQYLQYNRLASTRELINTDFHNSQAECMSFLQQIRRRLADEENSLSAFMETYQRQVEETLMKEHYRLRDQFLKMLEKAFQENQRRVKEMIRGFGNTEPAEFTSIRKRIAQVNADLDRLEHGLRNTNYRPTIAEVVMSDFESQAKEIQNIIMMAQKAVLDSTSKINLDEMRCNRIRDDVAHLIVIDGGKFQQIQNRTASPFLSITQQNPQRRSRARLFETAPADKQSGSFFNFNN